MLAFYIDEAQRFFTYWNMMFLAQAAANTILMALAGCTLGLGFGFLLATVRLERVTRFAFIRWTAIAIVEVLRRIPILVLLLFVVFAYQLSGHRVEALVGAVTAIVLRSASLFAENIRGGYDSIKPTQWDAAEAMNLSPWQTLRMVILPQAWAVILPPVNISVVGMIKATSLASQISVLELTFAARQLNLRGFSALICFGTILVIYFVISWAAARFGTYLENRLVSRRGRPVGSLR